MIVLLSILTLISQTTPLSVNGVIIRNPNLTNTANVTYSVAGSNVSASLTDGNIGAVLTPWPNTDNSIDVIWRKAPQIWEHAGTVGEWTAITVNSGTVTVAATPPDTTDVSVWRYDTASLTNGMAGERLGNSIYFGSSAIGLAMDVRTDSSLSTSAEGYFLQAGFHDASTDAYPTDGVFFQYAHATNSGAWQGIAINNGAATAATGGGSITVGVSTWYKLFLTVTSSTANFWVSTNGGSTVTFIGSVASNIPSTTARLSSINATIRKIGGSVGTTSRSFYIGRTALWPQ